MLAIAANGFWKPSETFIRSHVRNLAPVLLIAERRELRAPMPCARIIFSKRLPLFLPKGRGALALLPALCDPRRFMQSRSQYLACLLYTSDAADE